MHWLLALMTTIAGADDWRERFAAHADAGEVAAAIALAEDMRVPWLGAHLARTLDLPEVYAGWVETDDAWYAYGMSPGPWLERVPRTAALAAATDSIAQAVAVGDGLSWAALESVDAAFVAPLRARLPRDRVWTVAPDGVLERVPWPLVAPTAVVHTLSARTAAISAARTRAARRRPPTLFAYARSAPDDPDALPSAHAEIALAASALGDADARLLSGPDAARELRSAAYDGSLAAARFVLVAAHAERRGGAAALALDAADAGMLDPSDTLHLALSAELVVLSACETGADSAFAEAGARAGAALVLLTRWPVDDAAAAQFVAALFERIGRGDPPVDALEHVRAAFAAGTHGDAYRHPFHWAGWQLWGGV